MDLSHRRRVVGTTSRAIVIAVLASACTPDHVTSVPAAATESLQLIASAADIGATSASLEDARGRVAPALERLTADAELTDRLKEVEQAIRSADSRAVERALDRSDRAVARLRVLGDAAVTADLDAISLALADARRLLSPSNESAPTRAFTQN